MFKKILIGLFVLFFLLIATVVAIPFLFKDKIDALIRTQINKELLADVDYSDYDLSILKSFPDLYFTIENLSIVGRDDFEGDTLAKIQEIGIGLELMKFVRGEELQINSILIDRASLKAYSLITENGDTIANYDILPSSEVEEDTASAVIDVNVKDFVIKSSNVYFADLSSGMEVTIKNINSDTEIKYIQEAAAVIANLTFGSVQYNDLVTGMSLFFEDFKTDASIDYTEENAKVIAQADFNSLSYNDGSMLLLDKAKLVTNLNLDADLVNSVYTLKETEIAINALKLYLDGMVGLPDENTTVLDLKFNADKSTFKELLSLIPAAYLKDYQGLEASGTFDLKGYAKGKLTGTETPAFDVSLNIENGRVQYPDLPSAIEKINMNANFNNSTSDLTFTNVSIPNATFSVVGQDIQMSLFAQNALGDPNIDLKVKGLLPLNKIPDFYPLEGVNKIDGIMDVDFAFKGLLSDVENEKYENVDFSGKLDIANLVYDAEDLPMPLNVEQFNLQFSPQKASLIAKNAVVGNSDFNMNGSVENIINYALSDGTVKGKLAISSNKINLDELMGSETEETTEEGASTATKVPSNIDFVTSLTANEVYYDGLSLTNVKGAVIVADEKLSINDLSANMLGGSAKIDGSYSTKNTDKPEVSFAYDIQKFDIQQTFNQFNTVQAIAPLAKYLKGSFSTDMALSSFMNNDLSLDLNLLSGLGNVKIPYATFVELPMFQKISETLNIPMLKNPEINNAWTILKFREGNVDVEPFQVKMQDMIMDIQGSNGFDKTIDYVMKLTVPTDKFGGAASIANNFLSKQNIPLFNLAVPQNITFHLNVAGLLTSPTVKIVKVTADESGKGIKDQIKDNVKEQLTNVKDDIKNQAQQEADKLKEQAQLEADKLKEQAQQEADKLKEQAQQEADKLKENVKESVKDKIKGFKW